MNGTAPRSPRTALPFEVWALVAGAFAVALGYGVVAPVIPQFALEFGVSNFAASAIVSAFALMRLASSPSAGWLVNRFGERRVYISGLLIVAVSSGACVFAADYSQFLVLRGVGGIGSSMFTVAASALLIKVSPIHARGRVASLNAAGFLSGALLGPVFGALFVSLGMRAPFAFYFFTLIAAAIVVWAALRRSTVLAVVPNDERRVLRFLETARMPHYRVLLTSTFAFGWSSFGVRVSVVPLFAVSAFAEAGPTIAAWILAAYAAGNAVLIIPAGRWNDEHGRKIMLVSGLAIMAVSYAAFPLSSELWLAFVVMFVAGCGSALANPGQQAVLADIVGPRAGGGAVAGYAMTSDLGGVLGPLIAGAIVDVGGFGWAFGLTGALLAVACISWLTVPDSRVLQQRQRTQ